MAINENFVFSDAVPAQQAAAMAAIVQQGEAERRRQMSETLRSVTAAQVARENAAQQRAITQAQINQSNAELAQRESASIRNADINKMAIQNDREDRNARQAFQDRKVTDASQREQVGTRIATILADIEKSFDPPTPEDVEDAISLDQVGFSEAEKDHVRRAIIRRRANINVMADGYEGMAASLSQRLKSIDPALTVERQKLMDEANKNSDGYIVFDPQAGVFRSTFKRPKKSAMDAFGDAPVPIGSIINNQPAAPTAQPGFLDALKFWKTTPPPGAVQLPASMSWNPALKYILGYGGRALGIGSTNQNPAVPPR